MVAVPDVNICTFPFPGIYVNEGAGAADPGLTEMDVCGANDCIAVGSLVVSDVARVTEFVVCGDCMASDDSFAGEDVAIVIVLVADGVTTFVTPDSSAGVTIET